MRSAVHTTLATGLFVGLGGCLGYIAFISNVPAEARCSRRFSFSSASASRPSVYLATPRRHSAAATFAVFPSASPIWSMIFSLAGRYNGALGVLGVQSIPVAPQRRRELMNPAFIDLCGVMAMLANGFILTAMLWGGAVVFLIDAQDRPVGRPVCAPAVRSHRSGSSTRYFPSAGVYLPWSVVESLLPYHWTIGYSSLAARSPSQPNAGVSRHPRSSRSELLPTCWE